MRRSGPLLALGALLIAVLISFSTLAGFFVDWLWFDSLDFGAVFWTVWHTKLAVFALAGGLSFVVLASNGLIATRAVVLAISTRMAQRAGSTVPPLQLGLRGLRLLRHLPDFVRLYWRLLRDRRVSIWPGFETRCVSMPSRGIQT